MTGINIFDLSNVYRFFFQLNTNRAVVVIADGCGWGERPYEAAKKASISFGEFLAKEQK